MMTGASYPDFGNLASESFSVESVLNKELDTSGTLFADIVDSCAKPDVKGQYFMVDEIIDSSDTNSEDYDMLNYLMKPKEKVVKVRAERSPVPSVALNLQGLERGNNLSNQIENQSIVLDAGALLRAAREVTSRGPDNAYKRGECASKSALSAKRNRELKKRQFAILENEVEAISQEKLMIKKQLLEKCKMVNSLQKEVIYLRNIIANQSCLSSILNCIQAVPGLQLNTNTSNMGSANEVNNNTNNENPISREAGSQALQATQLTTSQNEPSSSSYVRAAGKAKRIKLDHNRSSSSVPETPSSTPVPDNMDTSGGVCLHVSNKRASLEFCVHCAESACENWKKSDNDHSYVKKEAV